MQTIDFKEAGWDFSYALHPVKGSSQAVILLPSAQSSRKRRNPYFSRWTWANDIGCNVIAVSDPTLQLGSELLGGWFQGLSTDYILPRTLAHLDRFLEDWRLDWSNCCFLGSSLGGFVALQMVAYRPAAKAFVDVPQTDLRRYDNPSRQVLAKYSYGTNDLSDVPQEFSPRLSVLDTLTLTQASGSVHYVQRINDGHHYREHFLPYVAHVTSHANKLNMSRCVFETIGRSPTSTGGHVPLSKEEALKRLLHFMGDS